MANNQNIVKSGWLLRQSTVLKHWKKNWVVLYHDGFLRYFASETSQHPEDTLCLSRDFKSIQIGKTVSSNVPVPSGRNRSEMLSVETTSKTWYFCGESLDDAVAWKYAMEQVVFAAQANIVPNVARLHNLPRTYSPYAGYLQPEYGTSVTRFNPATPQPYPTCQHVSQHPDQPYIIQSTDGTQTTIIYPDQHCYCRRRYGSDMGVGLVAGAALGTMMWGPLLW